MCLTCGCGRKQGVRIEGANGDHVHVLPDGTRFVHRHGHEHEHEHPHGHAHDHAHPLPIGMLPMPAHQHVHARAEVTNQSHAHDHSNGHGHDHAHHHHHDALRSGRESDAKLIELEASLLDKNRRIAETNRARLAEHGVFAVNLMSSPGSGKTTLLVRTLSELGAELPMSVVEGDQETSADAERIRATGAKAVQVNTGAGCHLEADMLERAIDILDPAAGSLLFVENVGNLVCPALFDLGEGARVVVLSCTEGDDKPLKYPHMFRAAELMVLTKTDLLPYVDFDADKAEANARTINPGIACLRVSSRSGEGMAAWYGWLHAGLQGQR